MNKLKSTRLTIILISLILFFRFGHTFANEIICNTTSEIVTAMDVATAGDTIIIEPGTYESTDFETGNAGTSLLPITIKSQDPDNQAILKSTSLNGGIVCEINHEYWIVQNLVFENASKGVVIDNASYSIIDGVTVSNTGQEGIHIINGSSNVQILNAKVFDCGLVTPDYGEAIYVGSDYLKWDRYDRNCHDNLIQSCELGPGVSAEHVDIKEGTRRTIVEDCIFYGEGISGANSAGSFIDAKGDSAIIRNNIGFRQNNPKVIAAFETHKKTGLDGSIWGKGNQFTCNKVYLDVNTIPIINATFGAIASDNTRFPEGGSNEYYGDITDIDVTCISTDCIGVEDGTATIDDCGVCSGGTTGIIPNSSCEQDCSGDWDGTASIDYCGECSGGNTGITPNSTCTLDCNNDKDGTATIDDCDVCSGGNTGIDPNSSCTQDCNNEWNGTASIDDCDVCSGGSTGITPNSTCTFDCNNDKDGTAAIDNCGVCSGGNTGIEVDECINSTELTTIVTENMVYPNPATDKIVFSDIIPENFNQAILYNTLGEIVLTNTLYSNSIDINHLSPGLYFIQFSKNGDKSALVKVIKQ